MGSLQTRLLNKWKTEDKIDFIDMNKSIKPSVFNDNWLAVKVNDDYWFNVKLKIANKKALKSEETGEYIIADCLFIKSKFNFSFDSFDLNIKTIKEKPVIIRKRIKIKIPLDESLAKL